MSGMLLLCGSSKPARADQPVQQAAAESTASAGRPDTARMTQHAGADMVAAGMWFSAYGLALGGFSAMYGPNSDTPNAGVALGLALGGLIQLGIGIPLVAAGTGRLKQPEQWLARKEGRRLRMTERAQRRGLTEGAPSDADTIARGHKLYLAGMVTLLISGLTVAGGVAVMPTGNRAASGALIGSGYGLVGLGIPLVVAGKRRWLAFERFHATVAPTFVSSPEGRLTGAVGMTGRF